MARRTTAITAAALSLMPLGEPLLLGTLGITTATAAVVFGQGAAIAQDASAVARIAKAVTVRIEGATQGSGVIVKREGNRYTVLTAWHVVSGNRPGEEVGIYTPDGRQHQQEQGSIQRLGQVDMAVLTFSSSGAYEVASVGDIKSMSSGNPIFVSGFPLATSSVPASIWRFLDGKVVANATVAIPDGYQLLYSNPTLPGMSGGAVLNHQGQLVGIHGKAERDDQVSMRTGKAIATGTNQGVPISYYKQFSTGQNIAAPSTIAPISYDDYIAKAKALLDKNEGQDSEVVRLMNQALSIKSTDKAYYYRAHARLNLGDYQGAIADYSETIAISPRYDRPYLYRAIAKRLAKEDYQGAIADCNIAIGISQRSDAAYVERANNKLQLRDYQGAIADYNTAITINPQNSHAYNNRAITKGLLRDYEGGCNDYKKAATLGHQQATEYLTGRNGYWCRHIEAQPRTL